WEWLVTLSHNDFALLEPEQVTIVYPSGNEVRDRRYRLIQRPTLSREHLRAAMQDEPVLQLAVIGLVWLAALAGAPPPVSPPARDADRLRLTTERLDLVFALEGATPISWRACHPSCAAANGRAVSISFAGAQDPPQARLRLTGAGTAIDLDRLRFTAE